MTLLMVVSRPSRSGTTFSEEYMMMHVWQAPQLLMNVESATHDVVELKLAMSVLHDGQVGWQ